ncbi:putative methyltransferase YcgJ [Planctomycetes bacterium Pla163]|uniref:Putative methyltransferase YcgJ n=1 Tax=Rohdeia mirabilis TaxID=2528008 RepID=A0A518D1T9_9BACT|nr:putative methyltransferase YcgJ [Planctomycetes bacterium Pla163]
MPSDPAATGALDADFPDHFSGHAADYAKARPTYPAELFAHLASIVPACGLAWDVGAGSGQSACALAEHMQRVVATDASAEQLAAARPHPRVTYLEARAEGSPLDDASVDLVTVAQALHWFDIDAFHAEVRRVARPGAILAEWSYDLMTVEPAVDAVVRHLYRAVVGSYWPPERIHVEDGYAKLAFPFERVETSEFAMELEWTLEQLLAYLGTWSSVRRFIDARGEDPVAALRPEFDAAWGLDERRLVCWPLALRVGRV